jgi:hypothetical protein
VSICSNELAPQTVPDGFEIGVAALEAELESDYNKWKGLVKNCFIFYNKQGEPYYRF